MVPYAGVWTGGGGDLTFEGGFAEPVEGKFEELFGSVDSRSISWRSFSRSRSSCSETPLELSRLVKESAFLRRPSAFSPMALSRSIWLRSWAPSDRRLLMKVSTFLRRLSTFSPMSL